MKARTSIQEKLIRREHIHQMLAESFDTDGVHKILEWVNLTDERYYKLIVGKDLLGDMLLIREWGSTVTKQGQRLNLITQPEKMGQFVTLVDGLLKRRSVHGYELITPGVPVEFFIPVENKYCQ
ncbi:hypothetical protein JCM30760_26210 [Thiomicrorhabdus hydrogeniphila]